MLVKSTKLKKKSLLLGKTIYENKLTVSFFAEVTQKSDHIKILTLENVGIKEKLQIC
jgi:hypothetical protein